MKRIFTLIVLLGIVMGAVLTGCNQGSDTSKPADTNAAPAARRAPTSKSFLPKQIWECRFHAGQGFARPFLFFGLDLPSRELDCAHEDDHSVFPLAASLLLIGCGRKLRQAGPADQWRGGRQQSFERAGRLRGRAGQSAADGRQDRGHDFAEPGHPDVQRGARAQPQRPERTGREEVHPEAFPPRPTG